MAAAGRVERLQDQIKKVVSEIIQKKVNDPNIGFLTITDVEVSKDLKHAKVFYSVYGDTRSRQDTAKALKKARGFILRELAREIRIKKLPELVFAPDNSLERGLRIQELLKQIESESDSEQGNQEEDN
jgi:ribosome-binding factor A